MARLSDSQVLQLLIKAKNAGAILNCQKQHEALRYHVQPQKDARQTSPYHRDFMAWVRSLLPEDKYLQFEKFYRLPVPTTDVSDRIFTQLERAFQADNQYVKVEFKSPEIGAEFELFRVGLGDNTFWQDKGFEAMQTAINSVVLVDLPRVQLGPRPEPTYYLMEINAANVHDVDFKEDGVADYIIFNLSRHQRAVFDDEYFRLVEKPENLGWDKAVITMAVPHSEYTEEGVLVSGLGYAPCCRFWDNLLNAQQNRVEAKGPITKLLGRMDEYLFDYYSLRYYKSYGKWPILWEYESKAPMHQHPNVAGLKCQGGYFVEQPEDVLVDTNGVLERVPQKARVSVCEECKKSRFTGPGSIKRVTPPQKNNDPDLRVPAGWIDPNPELVKLANEDLREAEYAIIEAAVGRNHETTGPRNELDVKDGVEVAQSMLLNITKNIAASRRFALETMAILMYGRELYARTTVDLGDEFFLKTEEQIKAEYKSGKDSGLPDYILAPTREMISETRYRNNDEMRMRQRILSNLQPYPDRTDAELQAWITAASGSLNANLIRLRMNFMAYVAEFEREQEMSIVDVAANVSFEVKIRLIRERLVAYVEQDFPNNPPLIPAPAAAPVVVAPLIPEPAV